jgi:hypothetical protein
MSNDRSLAGWTDIIEKSGRQATGAEEYFTERAADSTEYREALEAARAAQTRQFIVTIKLPRNPHHNPKNKITGGCPFSPDGSIECTDTTGEHHSKLVEGLSVEEVTSRYTQGGYHVTRVEEV